MPSWDGNFSSWESVRMVYVLVNLEPRAQLMWSWLIVWIAVGLPQTVWQETIRGVVSYRIYPFFVVYVALDCRWFCSVCWQYYRLCRHFACQTMSAKCLKIRLKVWSVRNLLVYLPAFMRVMHLCAIVLLGVKCVKVSDLECNISRNTKLFNLLIFNF